MTPERWKRTEELYQAARTRPSGERAAFLAEACRDDEALRRDVESLVNESDAADDFLSEPPLANAGHTRTDCRGVRLRNSSSLKSRCAEVSRSRPLGEQRCGPRNDATHQGKEPSSAHLPK